MILSAETIYSLESQQQLFDCIKQVSTSVSGTAALCCWLPVTQLASGNNAAQISCLQF